MIEDLSISWSRWFVLILIVIGVFMLVGFIIKLIEGNIRTGNLSRRTIRYLRKFRNLLEPFGISIIVMAFVLINPVVHGSLSTRFINSGQFSISIYSSTKLSYWTYVIIE